ncbi:acyl carrier protein [Streptomyces sp. CB03238]|uniref:acyl carrier protein n=1 Tax=Streptomyces sp. CB03238 TaxID=1907777 RepID=UPI000A0FCF88|nr:acyl carrier protein [Streptomyces sp. CB03238]ORT57121.1 polyketide synthase [Streptomyces sp. CB03238]
MPEITLAYLVSIIKECAGDSDAADLDGDILDVTFQDLGYDSLALLEVSARLQQNVGVSIPEDAMETPRGTLRLINDKISEVAV